eukprot:CAMPEP_0204586376 /NCGR_PEP_ID=MMETSP0661-20131031/47454_1 /ASSEMBLY_ACC=CAM_ASM_000606 /TAXON_ID=109239 /ORGANISM="Alexandrium margalefi, Strain AMGDE01CS-322" /LENGTH=73 /DNA_ID=CAMNT_0051596009 /DNA_START=63 /DNA_END=281 /DNA_ORIENTATION=-
MPIRPWTCLLFRLFQLPRPRGPPRAAGLSSDGLHKGVPQASEKLAFVRTCRNCEHAPHRAHCRLAPMLALVLV